MTDTITLLKTMNGRRMTKLWKQDGTIDGYEDAKHFKMRREQVASLDELGALLKRIEGKPDVCLIRGSYVGDELAEPSEYPGYVRRALVNFADQPLHAVMFDVDNFEHAGAPEEAIDAWIEATLPGGVFAGVRYWWQLSSSAGRTPGVLKAHVWFWLTEPLTSAQLRAWGLGIDGLDHSVFNPVQAHYTAAPVFEAGVTDPVEARSGMSSGWFDSVGIDVSGVRVPEYEGSSSYAMGDPREKPGMVGAFCRAFSVEEVIVRWLSDKFRFQMDDNERRLTYKAGGGSVGGAFISDDRMHVVNKHASDPCLGRAVNVFDLVRVHKFGHLDEGADPLDLVQIQSHPSHLAMIRMCEGLPEIAAEKTAAVASWSERIAAAALTDLEALTAEIGLDVGQVEQAALVQALRRRFIELGANMPVADIRRMMRPRRAQVALPDMNAEGAPQQTIENVAAVCQNAGIVVRYNCINKHDEIMVPGAGWTMDNAAEASLTVIRSMCHKAEIRTQYLKSIVTTIADMNVYNPVVEWVSSKPWDGVSRLQSWYDTLVEVTEAIERSRKELLMRKWALSAIAAAYSPDGVMARGVLVLQGAQYIGKTRWLTSLVPANLNLVNTGKSLNVHDKDSLMNVLSGWLAELGELDATFKKSDIAALKAFLTQTVDEIRRPYAAASSRYARRTVFAASVNDETFLGDPTGNSRFWVIPVSAVVHDHSIDMQQLWAEVLALWKGGEVHYLSQSEMGEVSVHNNQFEQADPIVELISDGLAWSDFSETRCKWMSASEILRWLDVRNPSKRDTSLAGAAVLKLNGGLKKRLSTGRYLAVPLSKATGSVDVVGEVW